MASTSTSTAGVTSTTSKLPGRLREHNLTLVAAGVAFYGFLALVPTLIAFVSIYGLVANPEDVTRQVQDLGSSLPAEVQDFLVFQLTSIVDASSAGVSITAVIAILLALWSASGGMAALITGIHIAHERDEPKGFVVKRGKALALTLARDRVPRRRDLPDRGAFPRCCPTPGSAEPGASRSTSCAGRSSRR